MMIVNIERVQWAEKKGHWPNSTSGIMSAWSATRAVTSAASFLVVPGLSPLLFKSAALIASFIS